ncbi:hypothetical protein QFC19_003384 [Naganishia cerealis]|uniref:Uncharacterized protein n=1 Tax=Naganishia cerealis TaxID=610337 RepID=A0ACC2W356_9TREE|nr:hypothetical protein QFC19_003384 [Naganishia cerealis]
MNELINLRDKRELLPKGPSFDLKEWRPIRSRQLCPSESEAERRRRSHENCIGDVDTNTETECDHDVEQGKDALRPPDEIDQV